MADEAIQTVAEILANLEEYQGQRAALEELLKVEPNNAEYLEMAQSLDEVLQLTTDLLKSAQDAEAEGGGAAQVNPLQAQWPLSSICEAIWNEKWYEVTVQGHTENGVLVKYTGYDDVAEVASNQIRQKRAVEEETYQGVAAPKRHKMEETILSSDLPKKLQITEEDDEATRDRKRKQIKAFKNRVRMQQKDLESNQKQNSWQQFQTGGMKKLKKKSGFSGMKKESMFKSPDGVDGKVGVTGSGKGLTKFSDRGRADRAAGDYE
mmetsp:Transcript_24816/g.54072  ORF Transcript_24816/g.54072 Transcript_24816/m.54072 type:complete len:264 (-) Transcript_24816:7-798(-)|eukprot:CAMPEP_0118957554 /NCGR_PEP_ID=MMETSP1169-20130426/62166_1 /TAXON_ID=36882 /ORGANISM="Pyramimonas obovata, Strain CCMP722" /LENGTH=263 /DNA_ID=CAMNT_0006905641 /DNA_START=126 /DNA_END=917 /DNA_ORIENTATION=-